MANEFPLNIREDSRSVTICFGKSSQFSFPWNYVFLQINWNVIGRPVTCLVPTGGTRMRVTRRWMDGRHVGVTERAAARNDPQHWGGGRDRGN